MDGLHTTRSCFVLLSFKTYTRYAARFYVLCANRGWPRHLRTLELFMIWWSRLFLYIYIYIEIPDPVSQTKMTTLYHRLTVVSSCQMQSCQDITAFSIDLHVCMEIPARRSNVDKTDRDVLPFSFARKRRRYPESTWRDEPKTKSRSDVSTW
jgi:hypothetical protein